IVAPGATRVTAPCPHYVQDRCGGCQLQHVTYEAQLAAKRAIVGDALRRIAKLDVEDPEIVEAVEEWRYRANGRLAVKGGRGRSGPGGGGGGGGPPRDSPRPRSSTSTRRWARSRAAGRSSSWATSGVPWCGTCTEGSGTPPSSWPSAGRRWSVWMRTRRRSTGHGSAPRRARCGSSPAKRRTWCPRCPSQVRWW